MKLLKGFIRTSRTDAVVKALEAAGSPGITLFREHGVGYDMQRLIPIILIVTALALPAWAATPRTATTFDAIMTHYETIRVALLNDTTRDVASHAKEISALANAATKRFDADTVGIDPARKDDCTSLLPKINEQANDLAATTDIGAARDAFFELSRSLVQLSAMASTGETPDTYYCPMAERSWLQKADEVGNPYYGQKMARCGQKVED